MTKSTMAKSASATDGDDMLKAELLALAKSGAPRPKANTRLGKALLRFTTK